MQQVFIDGGDFHSSCAKLVFNLDCDVSEIKDKYPNERQACKAVVFAVLYGSGSASIAEGLTKTTGRQWYVEEAQELIDDYFRTFPRLKKWLDEQKAVIKRDGFVYTFFNRKRRLSNVFSTDKGIAAHEIRSGINALVQSLSSDVNLLAAMEAAEMIKKEKLDAFIFMLVHDSIVVQAADNCVERVKQILRECTQRDRGCSIPKCPVGVDQEVGQDYSFGKFDKKYNLNNGVITLVAKEVKATEWVLKTSMHLSPDEEQQDEDEEIDWNV